MLTVYPRPEEFIGKEVDGHRIDAVLGRGGMGIVFKAENLELHRTVALKIINPALAQDESFLRRFRSEARALAQIHHPNIVIVYDFRQFDLGFYISMEYVKGPTLADHLEEKGPVPWKEGVYLTKQMLSAFHYAHSCGVIHRDIKPRNILLTKNNVVKITDFGLAKILQEDKIAKDTTVTMATGGTVHYMPPEQIRGLRNVDHRGDLFSLGMTMYEAIAGSLPFEKNASGYTIQKRIVEEPFPNIRKREPSVPKPLARIIMKSLEKEPHKRFQSAAEMISALEEFELHKKHSTYLVKSSNTPAAVSPPANNQRKMLLYGGGTLAVLLTLIAIIFPEKIGLSNNAEESPTLAEQLGTSGLQKADAAPLSEFDIDPVNTEKPAEGLSEEPDSSDSGNTSNTEASNSSSTEQNNSGNSSEQDTQPAQSPLAPPVGSINFDSTPRGARIYLNGVSIGQTPSFVDNLEPGKNDIELRLENHVTYKTTVDVKPYEVSKISGALSPITGLLKISVNPASSLFIDGKLVEKDAEGDLRLPLLATSHEILVSHPQLGDWQQEIDIEARDSLNINVDFTQKVRLRVTAFDTAENGMYGEIWVDGKSTGKYTPTPIEIPIGLHTIEIKSDGFEMVEDPQAVNYTQASTKPLRFTLRKAN